MKRRIAIKKIGLGVSSGLILPSWLAACKDEEDPKPRIDYKGVVVVVGAGAAGLYVADILQASGIEVIVLEASNRVGGRVRSLKTIDKPSLSLLFNSPTPLSNDFSPELGAEQVIGTDSIWGKIVSQLKLSTVNLEASATDSYFLDNALRTAASVESDADFIAAKNFLNSLSAHTGSGLSVEQAIQAAGINARVHGILNSWIGNKNGTENDRIGIRAIAEGLSQVTRNETKLLLTDNPMQDALLSRFSSVASNVQRNKVVRNIDYSGSKVIISGDTVLSPVSTEPFTIESDKVIVTVPASILKAGDILFNPALPPDKNEALLNMEMDPSLRILLDFKINFWGKESGFLYGGLEGPEYFNSGVGRSELIKTLSITVNGSKASALSLLGKDMIPVLLAELDSIYDGKATLHARRDLNDNIICVIQDWSKENYIRGGVAYLKPEGTNQNRINLGAPVNSKVFFAGEATDSKGESGTINGALLSAERAAAEVINSL